eukprot:1116262-Rhodomonas_salina.2
MVWYAMHSTEPGHGARRNDDLVYFSRSAEEEAAQVCFHSGCNCPRLCRICFHLWQHLFLSCCRCRCSYLCFRSSPCLLMLHRSWLPKLTRLAHMYGDNVAVYVRNAGIDGDSGAIYGMKRCCC